MFFINPFIYAGGGDFESIATVTVGSGGAASIEFASIPSTFQHLQIRFMGLLSSSNQGVWVRFNDDSAANYSCHLLYGQRIWWGDRHS